MAAGDLPPYVVSGQPIASTWGNGVVDDLKRLRNELSTQFSHPGINTGALGLFDIGQTNLGPYPYPVCVDVFCEISWGFGGFPCTANLELVNLMYSTSAIPAGQVWCYQSHWSVVPLSLSYAVPAGQLAGFKERIDIKINGGGGCFAAARGMYRVQRYGTP